MVIPWMLMNFQVINLGFNAINPDKKSCLVQFANNNGINRLTFRLVNIIDTPREATHKEYRVIRFS